MKLNELTTKVNGRELEEVRNFNLPTHSAKSLVKYLAKHGYRVLAQSNGWTPKDDFYFKTRSGNILKAFIVTV